MLVMFDTKAPLHHIWAILLKINEINDLLLVLKSHSLILKCGKI